MVEGLQQEKTLLVTGGTGYIGSHTIVELLQSQTSEFSRIVIVDNLENSSLKVIDRIEEITGRKHGVDFIFEECDLKNRD